MTNNKTKTPVFPKYDNYKNSGVEWLGEIPNHWDLIKVKNIVQLIIDPAPINNEMELLSIYTDIGVKPRKELEEKELTIEENLASIPSQIRQSIKPYEDQIVKLEKEKEEVGRMADSMEDELRTMAESHIEEMDSIESRVRQAICKKDDFILQLRDQIAGKDMRIVEIEKLVEKQRNEIISQL